MVGIMGGPTGAKGVSGFGPTGPGFQVTMPPNLLVSGLAGSGPTGPGIGATMPPGLNGTIVSGTFATAVSGMSGIGMTGSSGGPTGPTGAGPSVAAALDAKTALTVDAIVVRGHRIAGFIVPSLGEKVLSFLVTPERLEEAIGDFEQGFRLLATRQGLPHARRWYYVQVIKLAVRLIWPLISHLLKFGEIGGG